jgi:hypothetical protein
VIHFLNSDTPLVPMVDTAANCGEVVPQAIAGCTWDSQAMGTLPEYPSSLNTCKKCVKVATEMENARHQYIYAILSASEYRQILDGVTEYGSREAR